MIPETVVELAEEKKEKEEEREREEQEHSAEFAQNYVETSAQQQKQFYEDLQESRKLLAEMFMRMLRSAGPHSHLVGHFSKLLGLDEKEDYKSWFKENIQDDKWRKNVNFRRADFAGMEREIHRDNTHNLTRDTYKASSVSDGTRDAISAGIQEYVESARGTPYNLYNQKGGINCSSFVAETSKNIAYRMQNGVTVECDGKPQIVFFDNDKLMSKAATYSDAQIMNLSEGNVITNLSASNIKGGMVIGLNTGSHKWENNAPRELGIDHIAIAYKDQKTGKMMIAESASGKGGVSTTDAATWLANAQNKGYKIYGADLARQAEVTEPGSETALALRSGQRNGTSIARASDRDNDKTQSASDAYNRAANPQDVAAATPKGPAQERTLQDIGITSGFKPT